MDDGMEHTPPAAAASLPISDLVREPCPSCGSELAYSAELTGLHCDYCGFFSELDRASDKIVERSLAEVAAQEIHYSPEDDGQKVVECQNCGARYMLDADQVQVVCGFCGSTRVNEEAFSHRFIRPVGIIPFYISRREAEQRFRKWVSRGFFQPNALKRLARLKKLHGIYLPFWTYDAQTESDWQGEAGYYYYVNRTRMVGGKRVTTRVRKVRWRHRSGHLSHFFDDVLIPATGGLQVADVQRIEPYRLNELINFDVRYMLGWEAEVYSIGVDKGYELAAREMDRRIRQMCSAQLGGDTQRNLHVQSRKFNQTFKHIVLPLWMASYTYRNKTYRFFINGQTGKIVGDKPVSWVKIALLVLFFVAIMAGIYYLRARSG